MTIFDFFMIPIYLILMTLIRTLFDESFLEAFLKVMGSYIAFIMVCMFIGYSILPLKELGLFS